MWYAHEGMGWWMLIGTIWLVVFWALIIGLIVWAVGRLTERRPRPPLETAIEIAAQRYARGEITREEYEQIRQALER